MKRLATRIIFSFSFVALLPGAVYAMPWSWDMFSQPSYKAQEDSAPATPQGIVPAKGHLYVKDRADAVRLKSPVVVTNASIERGEAKYKIYCATCHGDTGKGEGLVGQKYVAPTDLTTEYVQKKSDGDIYYTITYGGLAIMPSYADSVAPEDRWHIVNYIKRSLGQKPAK
ncbi:MAG: cytochrome c [Deltaproteobacteria bacterium]|nr:cytochrome c [Deltaproteobacteria bacterium]